MKADGVWYKLLDGLYQKPWRRSVEHRHSVAVLDCLVRSNDTVTRRPMGVDSVRDISLHEDAQIQVDLVHLPYCPLDSSVMAILNVIRHEPDRCPLSPSYRSPRTPAHTLPMVVFSPPPTHRWELSILGYHKTMVIYPYPFFVVINQLFS